MSRLKQIKTKAITHYYGSLVRQDIRFLLKELELAKNESKVRSCFKVDKKALARVRKMAPRYIGRVGWDQGNKFRCKAMQVINGKIVLECYFYSETRDRDWTEFLSLQHVAKEKCFYYSENGKYEGGMF